MKDDRTRDKVGSEPGDMSNTDKDREQGGNLDRNRNIGTGSQSGQGSSRSSGNLGGNVTPRNRDDKDNTE